MFTSATRTFSWSAITTVGTYTLNLKGTLPCGKFSSSVFTITITNACLSSTITSPATITLAYTISTTAPTTSIIGTFTSSIANCAFTYSLQFFNGTAIAIGNPLFSLLSAPNTLQIGSSTDNMLAGPYTI